MEEQQNHLLPAVPARTEEGAGYGHHGEGGHGVHNMDLEACLQEGPGYGHHGVGGHGNHNMDLEAGIEEDGGYGRHGRHGVRDMDLEAIIDDILLALPSLGRNCILPEVGEICAGDVCVAI